MPRLQKPAVAPTPPVKQSLRKRKRGDETVDDTVAAHDDIDTSTAPAASDGIKAELPKRGRRKVAQNKTKLSTLEHSEGILPPGRTSEDANVILEESVPAKSKQSKSRARKSEPIKFKAKQAVKTEVEQNLEPKATVAPKKDVVKQAEPEDADEKVKKVVRKRKSKEEKEAQAMPLASRSAGLKMFVGAHVSIAKGIENAVTTAVHIGGNAFALFLKNQRRWDTPAMKDENRDAFRQNCTHHNYDQSSHVLPHGSYLVNLASPNEDAAKKSYDAFVDDLHRCEALGIKHYNFHPGSTNQEPLDEAIARLAGNLNRALAETTTVIPLLESMAGRGSVIGSRFTDLRDIIAAIKPEYKSRIGICIDTCHTFAAGYDLRTPEAFEATFQELDDTVGLQYLKAMHLNDSKAPLGSHEDLHQNIGVGFLGLRAFHNVMNDVRLQDIPLVLETPSDGANTYTREIKLLESLIGMDPDSEEFKGLEALLSERGRAEREKKMESIAAKKEKAQKKAKRELEKGQKTLGAMFGGKSKKKKNSVSSDGSSSNEVDSDA